MAIIGPSPYTGEKANDLGLNESVTFDDWNPTEEIKFVMANGQFHAAPDKDYEELARNAGAGPTYQGPMVMGTIHLDHGKAQFDNISTNLHAQGVNNLLQDWCVPLETEILTKDGWKGCYEVQVGDETLGYNPVTARLEWTPVVDVHFFQNLPMGILQNSRWSAKVTPNHRWYARRYSKYRDKNGELFRYAKDFFVETQDIKDHERIITAAPFRNLEPSDITPQEAAIVAWLYTDGTIQRTPEKDYVDANIWQTKSEGCLCLDTDYPDVPLVKLPRKIGGYKYHVPTSWIRPLLRRANLWEASAAPNNLLKFILQLAPDSLDAFMYAAYMAEGTLDFDAFNYAQNVGSTLDALVLGCYLLGASPSIGLNGGQDSSGRFGKGNKNYRVYARFKQCVETTGSSLSYTRQDELEDAWCVTTTLGTWTMRQGHQILLTGNCQTKGWQWGGAASDGLTLSPSSVTSMYFQADGGHLSFAKSAKSLERVSGAIHIKGHKVYPYPLNPNYYQAIREWADDHSMIIMAGDNVIKTVEDLEQHDLYSPEWNNPEDHFMGRDPKQDDKTPQGPQRCQYCKEWFPSFNSLIEHQKNDEEPWDDINEQDRNKMQSPPDMDDPIPWKFLETPKYYGAASVQAIPFIYDIKNDDIEVGQPGVTVDTLNSVRFTPGGVMRGIFDNGKLILQSGSDYQVSVAHLLQLWAYKMPHLYVKSVWLEDQSGKPTKLASEGWE